MIPLKQTIFGTPYGNCFATCVASLLELPLHAVPNFCAPENADWWRAFNAWLREHGACALLFAEPNAYLLEALRGATLIAGGPSPRGAFDHAVLWRDGACIHDPHPDNTGILSLSDVTVIVPLDGRAVRS